ncbi:hypothetical protein CUM97_13830 [Enterococcus mundtii]|nr:hypothetical protein CUM97_13830 [Enterococcus mundtii]
MLVFIAFSHLFFCFTLYIARGTISILNSGVLLRYAPKKVGCVRLFLFEQGKMAKVEISA